MHHNSAHNRKQVALCSAAAALTIDTLVQHNRPYADMVCIRISNFLPVLRIKQLLRA